MVDVDCLPWLSVWSEVDHLLFDYWNNQLKLLVCLPCKVVEETYDDGLSRSLSLSVYRQDSVIISFSQSNQKASTVERFQRTLQHKIYTYLTEYEALRYINVLQSIITIYNITKHSFLKFSPMQVETSTKVHNRILLKHADKFFKIKPRKAKIYCWRYCENFSSENCIP